MTVLVNMNSSNAPAFDVDFGILDELERRRDPRFELSLAITLQGANNFYTGLSEDISDGGVFIATHVRLAVGTPVTVWITIPGSDAPTRVSGTVRWVREPSAIANAENNFCGDLQLSQAAPPGMGVQFHDVSDPTRQAIRSFMTCRRPDFFE